MDIQGNRKLLLNGMYRYFNILKVRRITRKNLIKALRKKYGKFDTIYFDWNFSTSVKALSDDELYDLVLGKNRNLDKMVILNHQYQGIGKKILYISRKPIKFEITKLYETDTNTDENGSIYFYDKEYKSLAFEIPLGVVIKEEDGNCYLYDNYLSHSRKSF